MNNNSNDAIVIERHFNAPIETVWEMWTNPEHFKNWYGPEGFTVSVAEIDLKLGGKRRFCMEQQDGSVEFWLAGEYTEINPYTLLAYTEGMADEQGNILPLSEEDKAAGHTAITVISVVLEALGERTKMVMRHAGVPSHDEGASAGWQQALDKMAAAIQTLLMNAKS